MTGSSEKPLAPSTRPPYYVGCPIELSGYVDDFDRTICAMEFSLDDGTSWTAYPTTAVDKSRGVNWRFVYTPQSPGRYLLKVRPVTEDGEPSSLVAGFAFEALPAGGTFGNARIRAVGGSFKDARIFRSRELTNLTGEEAAFLSQALGIATIYDLRTAAEVAAHPEPYIVGMRTVALEPSTEHRRKDSDKRLIAGVIGKYGEPEERMCANYRRYVREYPLVGQALRSMAAEGRPALIHCVNGKDRTGVLCATLLRVTGADEDAIMEDYLRVNEDHADLIAEEASRLDAGMTDRERAMLMSFLEARPAYLRAYFDEIDRIYGTFETYMAAGLHLTPEAVQHLKALVA
ncbi:tyrosine-protein phosphatase [Adlercreutzia sp. R25]|uniref:tyrosine-protein phosphatase n=1 Tax=Adlercreutzia shanghongiae TaxID=3111773 RepID=UPI002DB896CE|nr:tyrosine-protein phosphatase [Adlercreutzia sp. R25]MEC4273682.1 tyrosine-protein phosphatase [Adlercreutzia sp. R25]